MQINTNQVRYPARWIDIGMIALLALSVSLNVVLAWRFAHPLRSSAVNEVLPAGTRVPVLPSADLNSASKEPRPEHRPTVLYVFTPECSWCLRNLANIKALAAGVQGRYRVIGVSLTREKLTEYLKKYPLNFPVAMNPPAPSLIKAYNMRSTPSTIVVSPEGRVIRSWAGAFEGVNRKEIEEFFKITLPGLLALEQDNDKAG